MGKLLLLVFNFALESAVKRLVVGAGLAIGTMTIIQTLFNLRLQAAINASGSLDSAVLGLAAIAKLDICISILLGAAASRAAIAAASLTMRKA